MPDNPIHRGANSASVEKLSPEENVSSDLTLPALPAEILHQIFSELSPKDLCSVAKVDSTLNWVTQNQYLWKKSYQKMFDGLNMAESNVNWRDRTLNLASRGDRDYLRHVDMFSNFRLYTNSRHRQILAAIQKGDIESLKHIHFKISDLDMKVTVFPHQSVSLLMLVKQREQHREALLNYFYSVALEFYLSKDSEHSNLRGKSKLLEWAVLCDQPVKVLDELFRTIPGLKDFYLNNNRNKNKMNPLMYAVEGGQGDHVQFFIENGLNIGEGEEGDILLKNTISALFKAPRQRNRRAICEALLKNLKCLPCEDCRKKMPLNVSRLLVNDRHDALQEDWRASSKKLLELLIEDGLALNQYHVNGMTLLHMAILQGREDIVDLLIEHGVDVNLRTQKSYLSDDINIKVVMGDNPLDLAQCLRNTAIVQKLVQKGGAHTSKEVQEKNKLRR